MKIMKIVVGSLMLAALPLAAQADENGMSYSFIDLGWNQLDIDGATESGDGIGVRGSVGFADNFFAFADYGMFDFSGGDFDLYSVGLGGRLGISDNLDAVGRAGYLKGEASGVGGSIDDDGYLVAAGLRGSITDSFELEGNVIYRDFGGTGGDDTAIAVGGRYHFTDTVAVGAEFQHSDDFEIIFAGVRFSF
jgi:hypothetical protein